MISIEWTAFSICDHLEIRLNRTRADLYFSSYIPWKKTKWLANLNTAYRLHWNNTESRISPRIVITYHSFKADTIQIFRSVVPENIRSTSRTWCTPVLQMIQQEFFYDGSHHQWNHHQHQSFNFSLFIIWQFATYMCSDLQRVSVRPLLSLRRH